MCPHSLSLGDVGNSSGLEGGKEQQAQRVTWGWRGCDEVIRGGQLRTVVGMPGAQ